MLDSKQIFALILCPKREKLLLKTLGGQEFLCSSELRAAEVFCFSRQSGGARHGLAIGERAPDA